MTNYIILFSLIILPFFSFSQDDVAINPDNPDLRLAEYFLKLKIDSVRSDKNIDSLLNDSVLFAAASQQAGYLNKQKRLSNKNPQKKYSTPARRVDAFGAKNYIVTEKIARIPFHVPIQSSAQSKYPPMVLTYRQLVSRIYNIWMADKNTSDDLKAKEYRFVGSAFVFNSDSYEFTCVLLLAKVKKTAKPKECSDCFPYQDKTVEQIVPDSSILSISASFQKQKIAGWPKKQKVCSEVIKHTQSVSFYKGNLICKYSTAKKLFKGWRSGFMMEFISLESMHNNDFYELPSRRNGYSIFNGENSEMRLRFELFREAKHNYPRDAVEIFGWKSFFKKKPEYFVVKLPRSNASLYSSNIIFVNKKKVCKIMPLHSVYFEFFNIPVAKVPYETKLPEREYPLKKPRDSTNATVDTLNFTLWFKKNESVAEQEELKPVISYFNNKSVITSIKIEAYASIEGNELMNQNLYKRRAENFVNVFKKHLDPKLITNITTQENWTLFEEQIPETRFKSLVGKSREEMRKWVNKHNKETDLEALLAKQRYAYVQMVTRKVDTMRIDYDTLSQYRNMINKYNTEIFQTLQPRMNNRNAVYTHLRDIQLSLYTGYKQGKVTIEQVDSLNTKILLMGLPLENSIFVQLIYDKIIFDYFVAKRYPIDETFYEAVKALSLLTATDSKGREKPLTKGGVLANCIYNKNAYLINNFDNYFSEDMGKYELYNELNTKKKKKTPTDEFYLNINIYQEVSNFAKQAQKHGASGMVADSLKAFYFLNSIMDMHAQDFLFFRKEIDKKLPAIDRYFIKGKQLTPEERIRYARFFIAFGKTKTIQNLLNPLIETKEPDHQALMIYLKYMLAIDNDIDKFYPLLEKAAGTLTHEEWCSLFRSDEHLGYFILENGKVRTLYCKTCGCGS